MQWWTVGRVSRAITAKFIGDQAVGNVAQPLQQPAKEPFGRPCIPAFLHENIERLAVLIHGPPQVVALAAADADKHFVQMPGIARSSSSMPQLLGKCLGELEAPLPDRFIANDYAAFG